MKHVFWHAFDVLHIRVNARSGFITEGDRLTERKRVKDRVRERESASAESN